jgi:HEAT repeat protein
MEEDKSKKIPVDAKLLSDAIIELNISRRSVGLYPRDHPIIKESLVRAFDFLRNLFELSHDITLAVAKDVLMVGDFVLDARNPVFKEFAMSLHRKGIATVTFYSGLTMEELLGFHELLVSKDAAAGQAMIEYAEKKGIRSIKFIPLDISKFSFVEDRLREEGGDRALWESYISGLLNGKLAGSDGEGVVLGIPPEDIASFINDRMLPDANEMTYDSVITSYLKKRDSGIRTELFSKFLSFINNLSPQLKGQFIKRAFNQPFVQSADIERLVRELTVYDVERLERIFHENTSLIPESLDNLLNKLSHAKAGESFFDMLSAEHGGIDDIQMDENILHLFKDDQFKKFVSEDYQKELNKMLQGSQAKTTVLAEELEKESQEQTVDRKFSEITLELLETDFIEKEDYLSLLSRISIMTDHFGETGRFSEISEIYNAVYSHTLTGKFKDEASGMVAYFFHSKEFLSKFIESLKVWGRVDREGALRLAKVNKRHLITPLLDAVSDETAASVRKFLLDILGSLGSDIVPEVTRRLNDERWYIVRNMIYLLREAGGIKHVGYVRRFARDQNRKVCLEAIKTLIHFKTGDALSYIKLYLQGDDPVLRDQVVKLTGTYKYKSAVPHLLQLLEKRDVFGSKLYDKLSIARALGKIGDPRALPVLTKLCCSKAILFKAALNELKVEIFRGLDNYPPASITGLLETGLRSKNDEIRTISEKMLGEKGAGDV